MRRLVAACLAVVVVVVASGCAEKVAVPPASARPDEVVAAFLKASIAGETKVMRELSGDCWPNVSSWPHLGRDLFTDFTVGSGGALPGDTKTTVRFSSHDRTIDWDENDYEVTLRRCGPEDRWRVCDVQQYWPG